MKLVVRIKNQEEIRHLTEIGADVFLLDTDNFTTKAIFALGINEMKSIVQYIKSLNKEVYVLINKMIHEPDILRLKSYLSYLKELEVDAIVINDFSVYVIAKEIELDHLIIYQPGTMNTNSFDVTYLKNRIKGMTLSKEITLDEIQVMIESSKDIEFSIIGHGYIDMFYSKRKLITHYLTHKDLSGPLVKGNQGFVLEEKTRENMFYPIYEDEIGTHIFRDKKLESFKEIQMIKDKISDFFIERIFMDDQEYYHAVKAYLNQESVESFLKQYGASYNKGFYYTPTEKRKGEIHEN
ncbi:MAG: peptidase U32 family protein [Candidatus Izemoplasmatales bacterium]|uniref:U32 family peptidase n=1 Tax=Hujiaoplasma nucleasis TaxID=2725268 RepID=A0A7L6MZN7_9MOLU|nr:U32 family peptidase [Hujiaoplasma nucleasis]QLY39456.1 hypothetical protein HF295_00705 [Hujiaoplasma nucleasis]